MHSNEFKLRCSKAGLLLLLLTLSLLANSQATFEKIIGFESEEWGHSVLQTADSGYIICGYTDQFQFKYDDVYLIKTDELGNIIWTNNYGSSALEQGYSIKPISDGGFIIAGDRYSPMYETIRAYIIRTDAFGDTLWTRKFAGPGDANGRCAIETSDGGFVFCGVASGNQSRKVYLVKLNESGEVIWEKSIPGIRDEWSFDMKQTLDGGYIICGGTEISPGYDDFLIIKTDENGDTTWTRHYGEDGYDAAYSIIQASDGNYFVVGNSWNIHEPDYFDVYLIKLNMNGDTIWTKRYGGTNDDFGYQLDQINDEELIICGRSRISVYGNFDMLIIKTDTAGNLLWSRTFGGNENEACLSIKHTFDDGYVLCGYTNSFGDGSSDIYFIKTNEDGLLTGIGDTIKIEKTGYQIYPNPNHGLFSINLPFGEHEVRIINQQNQVLFMEDIPGNVGGTSFQINVKSLPAGIYFMKIKDHSGHVYSKKLIIN